MPVVNTNIIKEWFSNLKKPPQEQFWAWLDSFRHKWEKIPLLDIEGLIGILQKKADLVDGVVPEYQLPFSVVTSEVLALGAVSVTNKINLAVHSSGANKVRVKGRTIIRSFPNQWDFTPFVGSGIKVIRGYAEKSEDDFFISEGDELPTYTEPQIPENALEIFKITISINGIVIDQSSQFGSKMKADDQWTNAYLDVEEGDYLSIQNQPSSFNLVIAPTIMNPKLFGVMTVRVPGDDNNFAWDGKEFLLYTERDVLLTSQESNPVAALPFVDGTNYTAKAGTYTRLKLRENKVVVLPGGGANFPDGGNVADVLVKTADGEVWSNRLTNAETTINANTANIAIEHSTNVAQDLVIADLNIHQITIVTTSSITTNTLDALLPAGKGQNGREVGIKNGVNAINLTCEITSPASFLASYTKEGSAAITIVAGAGTTLYQTDGTNVINGIKGSTFCIKRSGNEFQLQISNR